MKHATLLLIVLATLPLVAQNTRRQQEPPTIAVVHYCDAASSIEIPMWDDSNKTIRYLSCQDELVVLDVRFDTDPLSARVRTTSGQIGYVRVESIELKKPVPPTEIARKVEQAFERLRQERVNAKAERQARIEKEPDYVQDAIRFLDENCQYVYVYGQIVKPSRRVPQHVFDKILPCRAQAMIASFETSDKQLRNEALRMFNYSGALSDYKWFDSTRQMIESFDSLVDDYNQLVRSYNGLLGVLQEVNRNLSAAQTSEQTARSTAPRPRDPSFWRSLLFNVASGVSQSLQNYKPSRTIRCTGGTSLYGEATTPVAGFTTLSGFGSTNITCTEE